MMKNCQQCGQNFEVTESDLSFLEKVSPVFNGKKELIPPSPFCSDCRFQRRLLFRNDLCLYHRKSDLTGKQILSIYAADKPLKVYDQDEWWSDRWDELSFGRPFDFGKTFTEQFAALGLEVPHMSLFTTNVENSTYTNHSLNCRNCYLLAGATNLEDCLYGRFVIGGKDDVDCLSLFSCDWCYEGIASQHCYQCSFFMNCRNCSDCLMAEDCLNCKNCCLCFGLKDQEYCFLNEKIGRSAYEERMKELLPLTRKKISMLRARFDGLKKKLPHRASHIFGSEDCTGDMVFNSKNCRDTFDCTDCEDCRYLWNTPKGISSQDCNYTAPDGVQYCYNVGSTVGVQRAMGTFLCWYGSDLYYCRECHHCESCFGCVGLRRKKFCVLNTQYTKEEYEKLVPKIIEKMRTDGEWGNYLDPSLSYMGYNETLAMDHFPLTQKEVEARGWRWYVDQEKRDAYMGPNVAPPETIAETPKTVCDHVLRCSVTGRPFKIIPQEFAFCQTMGMPIPDKCPDQRHKERMNLRTPRRLWKRQCAKCGKEIETSYAPDRSEIVYCEECYLKEVY